jgi:two-component system sporulation sensor kinase A
MFDTVLKEKEKKNVLLREYFNKNMNQFESLFQDNKDAIFVQDLDGYVVKVNTMFKELLLYTDEELALWKILKNIPTYCLDKLLNHFEKTILGYYENFDCDIVNKKGELLSFNLTFIPISVENQIVGIYTVAKNITELKRKKQEIRKIEEFHSFLTENILDLITNTNLLGQVLYVSPACERILGYTADELLGTNIFDLLHPDERDRAVEIRRKTIIDYVDLRHIYQLRKKDGTYIWVESLCKPIVDSETNNIVEFVSAARDITEQIKMEAELQKQQNAYRDLVKNSPDAMLIADKGNIVFINETGLKLLGAAEEKEILYKSAFEFIHPDYVELARERMMKVSNGEIAELREYKFIKTDGTVIDVESKAIPTIFNNKPVNQIYIRDLTASKKANKLILQSEKLSTVGQLAAGIAHEVRNPLTAIKGFLQLLESQSENHSYFEIINSEITRIELILSELLILGKPKDSNYAKENLKMIIEDVTLLIGTQAIMNNVEIKLTNEWDEFTINCDKNQIKQVLINFLKNSIEAMKNGSEIMIEVIKHGNNHVKILIKDNGPGIPPHILKRIGEPFFTTKENGTGLGMMISKQIIENHKGTLNFWSDNQGTIVEVILPL